MICRCSQYVFVWNLKYIHLQNIKRNPIVCVSCFCLTVCQWLFVLWAMLIRSKQKAEATGAGDMGIQRKFKFEWKRKLKSIKSVFTVSIRASWWWAGVLRVVALYNCTLQHIDGPVPATWVGLVWLDGKLGVLVCVFLYWDNVQLQKAADISVQCFSGGNAQEKV